MKTPTKIATGIAGLLLVVLSMGILAESGLMPRTANKPFNGVYLAVGAPILALGIWLGHKAGLRAIRPFARR